MSLRNMLISCLCVTTALGWSPYSSALINPLILADTSNILTFDLGDLEGVSPAITATNPVAQAIPVTPATAVDPSTFLPKFPSLESLNLQKLNAEATAANVDLTKAFDVSGLKEKLSNADSILSVSAFKAALPTADSLGISPEIAAQISAAQAAAVTSAQPVIDYLSTVPHLFVVATFFPQLFWLLIILPKLDSSPFARWIMGPLTPVIICAVVHAGIVALSLSADGGAGTAPLADFQGVFDPMGDPQEAMMSMMKYPNFVAEEWR